MDRCFRLPHRLAERIRNAGGRLRSSADGPVLVIKFMGMGSLIQFGSLCESHHVDKNKIVVLTLAVHREVCELFGFDKALFIRTRPVVLFFLDCLKVLALVRTLRPACIVDYERCSHAVSLYRNLLAWVGQCTTLSFEDSRNISLPGQIVHPVGQFTQDQLLLKGIELMPRKAHQSEDGYIVPFDASKIIININASNYMLARRFPANSYEEVIKSLHRWNEHLKFFLTGSRDEFAYVDKLTENLNGIPVQNVCGKWNLVKLTRELMGCTLFITGDSGPLHLAASLSIPTIAIWGPTQPQHFGYESKSGMVHASLNLSCAPCLRHPGSLTAVACRGKINCLNNLSPDAVIGKAVAILDAYANVRSVRLNGIATSFIQSFAESQIA